MRNHIVTIIICCFWLFSCAENTVVTGKKIQDLHYATPLKVESVVKDKVPQYYSATGYTAYIKQIEISTSQSGVIKKLDIEEGDVVKKGQLLIVIDESELITSINNAKAKILSAKINLQDRIEDEKTALRLRKSKMVSADKLRKAQVQLSLAKSQLAQANIDLKQKEDKKPYYRITSPMHARVIKRWVNRGDLAVAGKPLFQLEATKGLEFETSIPTQWLDKINIGDEYLLKIHSIDKLVKVKVSKIVRSTDRMTQTNLIKLAVLDESHLVAGLSGELKFVVNNDDHLLIPSTSIVNKVGVIGVYVVDEVLKVHFTSVSLERQWGNKHVILSGLKQGDLVIINAPSDLKDGSIIKSKSNE